MYRYLIPDSNIIIYDGSIVTLTSNPNNKYIVHYNWYTYQDESAQGWYLQSIPDGSIIPIYLVDPKTIKVVNSCGPEVVPPVPPVPPCPPYPPSPDVPVRVLPFTEYDKAEIARSFISVNNLTELHELVTKNMPNGKMVRVNNTGSGEPGYYAWDNELSEWVEQSFGGHGEGNASVVYGPGVTEDYPPKVINQFVYSTDNEYMYLDTYDAMQGKLVRSSIKTKARVENETLML